MNNPPVPPAPLLSEPVCRLFREAGCPEDVIAKLGRLDFGTALSGSTNPINAYVKFAENNAWFNDHWLPKRVYGKAAAAKAGITVTGGTVEDFDSLYDIKDI